MDFGSIETYPTGGDFPLPFFFYIKNQTMEKNLDFDNDTSGKIALSLYNKILVNLIKTNTLSKLPNHIYYKKFPRITALNLFKKQTPHLLLDLSRILNYQYKHWLISKDNDPYSNIKTILLTLNSRERILPIFKKGPCPGFKYWMNHHREYYHD